MKAHDSSSSSNSSRGVEVFVRIRPTANFDQEQIVCPPDGQTINIFHRKETKKAYSSGKTHRQTSWSFRLDGVLQDVSQEDFYTRVCRPVVLAALDGYSGTVMCFGQTGSGKTYTMTGSTESYQQRGIIPRALQEVFQEVGKRTEHAISVHLSYLEIYNETLVDLLASLRGPPHRLPRSMVVTEEPGRGVHIKGLSLHPVHSEAEALHLLFEGEMNRIIGSHALNRCSSRSHCIFTIQIESHSRTLSDPKYVTSKLNLVDLAGSERLGKTGSEGQMLKEAKYINKSLSFLEQAIIALGDKRRDHVSFRQTKLTHALKDSLGGKCNTVLVANIYAEAAQIDETLSTLRFAGRMKRVQADPAANEHMDPAAQIKKLEQEVQTLKEELSIANKLGNRRSITYEAVSESQLAEIHNQVHRYIEGSLEEISFVSIRHLQAVFAQFKLAVQEEEQRVKDQLCQTYDLVKKDPAAVKDPRGSTEDVGAGQSLKETHHTRSSKAKSRRFKEKQSQSKSQGGGSPVSRTPVKNVSKSKLNPAQTPETPEPDADSQDVQESQPRDANSPTFKAEAFEDFKMGRGREMNRVLKENKAIVRERRSLLRQLTEEVNTVKRQIDRTVATIHQNNNMREGQDQYLVMDGRPVLPESDAALLTELKELKELYRQRYEVLQHIKAEVNYGQHLADQCRVQLLSEFENWYEKSFMLPEEEQDTPMEKEDPQQQPLTTSPSSESFYNSRCRILRRRNSRKSSTPVQRNSSAGSAQRGLPPIT